jgi:HSP20 family molecular chaperone IbpA
MEFAYGVFERSFALPRAVAEDGVEAVLKDGVLTIRLPLADVIQGREIKVGG